MSNQFKDAHLSGPATGHGCPSKLPCTADSISSD
eukprot:CAMPEP_0174357256 /NCGR_PEP_ID=MMETSP0811_2-20130205/34982_1 /TAXON_ID=73025 ORGANISM="Eutreptiella gymnastica-like, Strain CCMP1594" /NCGR_SAMPLE_ID=MMETSP0811_2 /ASSEMBLY_ACC=CAM_ASM_000667 /LENGTH=33 /DNA_ID= /DNA_START= /DNA_END= /DNA_ORIENTATION=